MAFEVGRILGLTDLGLVLRHFFFKGHVNLSIHAMIFEGNKIKNLKVGNRDIR
jgi:hypothetical protein